LNQAVAQGATDASKNSAGGASNNFFNQIGPFALKKLSVTGIFCRCKKSHCRKGYCECFTNNKPCTERCGCEECENVLGGCTQHGNNDDGPGPVPALVTS
jgi:hypothetical protein